MASMNLNSRLYVQKLSYCSTAPPYQCLTQQWFIKAAHPVYQPRHGCQLEPLICGQNVFASISADVNAAQHTVDIITWGFDPGMVLVRGATAEAGIRYGDLLKSIATRSTNPVHVRLLVWHDDVIAQKLMNNLPGYYGRHVPGIGSGTAGFYSDEHYAYNAAWFDEVSSGTLPALEFHVREVPHHHVVAALAGEALPGGIGVAGAAAAMYPAHHQKMVLIDYDIPDRAVGYVMGHNSITDFWDSEQHLFRDPQRERIYQKRESEIRQAAQGKAPSPSDIAFGYHQSEQGKRDHQKMVDQFVENCSHVAKPYQDVSCRIQGPVLYDMNHNFCQAWQTSESPSALFADIRKVDPLSRVMLAGHKAIADVTRCVPEFIKQRDKIKPAAFKLPNGQHSVQLVRTQPQYAEKGAKECYANLTRQMRHYIFIQNQYIQYVAWAEHLIECVGRLRVAGYLKPVYVFILTSTPERDGMDLPTYGVASKIGMSQTMKIEHEEALERARQKKGEKPITAEDMQK